MKGMGASIKYVRFKGEGGGQGESIYCFYDIILLFKSVQGGRGCLKITKFERTYFMDGPNTNKMCVSGVRNVRFLENLACFVLRFALSVITDHIPFNNVFRFLKS